MPGVAERPRVHAARQGLPHLARRLRPGAVRPRRRARGQAVRALPALAAPRGAAGDPGVRARRRDRLARARARGSARRGDRMGPGAAVHRVLPEGEHPRRPAHRGVDGTSLGPARADRLAARTGPRRASRRTDPGRRGHRHARARRPALRGRAADRRLGGVQDVRPPVSPPRTPSHSPSSSTRPSSCACSPSGARTPTRPAAGPRSAPSDCSRRCARTWWPRP